MEVTAVIPYSEGALLSSLHDTQKILSEDYTELGTKVTLLCDEQSYSILKPYISESEGE